MRVIIIGGGMAGAAAALGVKSVGQHPLIVRAYAGASALCAGAWDVAADVKAVAGDRAVFRPTIAEALRNLAAARPTHPYGRLGTASVRTAHDAVLAKLGLYLPIEWEAPLGLVATDLGYVRGTASAQASVLRIDALRPGSRVAVVELAGYREVDAVHVAASLSEWSRQAEAELTFAPVEVDFLTRRTDALLHPHEIARVLDTEEGHRKLTGALSDARRRVGFDAALLPAVLGLERVFERAARLREDVGVPVGEMLAGPGSPQGLRLQAAIEALFDGPTKIDALATGVQIERRRASAVKLADRDPLAADAVVLCTGRFLGGGIAKRGRVLETLLDLPLYLDGKPFSDETGAYGTDPTALFREDPLGRHAAMRIGVGWDDKLRPLGPDGAVACENLFAAGDLLEGHDPATDLSGLGVALTTGYMAGRAAGIRAQSG